jgi:hypothetical protein
MSPLRAIPAVVGVLTMTIGVLFLRFSSAVVPGGRVWHAVFVVAGLITIMSAFQPRSGWLRAWAGALTVAAYGARAVVTIVSMLFSDAEARFIASAGIAAGLTGMVAILAAVVWTAVLTPMGAQCEVSRPSNQ